MLARRVTPIILVAALFLVPARADLIVAGSTSAIFANPSGSTGVNGNVWNYDPNDPTGYGTVTFNGTGFSGSHYGSFNFGSITLANNGQQPNGEFAVDLVLTILFTTPAGQHVTFTYGLEVDAKPGSSHSDELELDILGFPGPQFFTVDGTTYEVAYDGFFNSSTNNGTRVTSLFVPNHGGTATAYLWGSVTDPPSSVPEPASVCFLATVVGGIFQSLRRKMGH